jgi:hypothetical protein
VDKIKYSIEYAHIYTDEQFGAEHIGGVYELARILSTLKLKRTSYALTVLIDNYNPHQHTLNRQDFIARLDRLDARPDFLGLEASLVSHKDQLLDAIIKPKVRREYRNYLDRRPKLPCSFLVSIWYLMRLGALPIAAGSSIYTPVSDAAVSFTGQRLINILPDRFREVEDQALKLIRSTIYHDLADNIPAAFYAPDHLNHHPHVA